MAGGVVAGHGWSLMDAGGEAGRSLPVLHGLRVVNVDERGQQWGNDQPSLAMKGTSPRGGSGASDTGADAHPPRLDDPEAGRVPFTPTHGRARPSLEAGGDAPRTRSIVTVA